MNPQTTALLDAFERARHPEPADLLSAVRGLPDPAALPSPWETWTLIGLVRHRDRQLWVAEIMRNRLRGAPADLAAIGAWGHPEVKKFILYLDNAKYYDKPVVQEWLARHPQFHLEPVPPYSPNLNLIERLWKFLRQKALTRWHKTFEAMQVAVAVPRHPFHQPLAFSYTALLNRSIHHNTKSVLLRRRYTTTPRNGSTNTTPTRCAWTRGRGSRPSSGSPPPGRGRSAGSSAGSSRISATAP
jgi:transposase